MSDPKKRRKAFLTNTGDGEEQRIRYEVALENMATGAHERILIEVSRFNDPRAAIQALKDTARCLEEFLKGEVDVEEVPRITDEDIAKLLNSDN